MSVATTRTVGRAAPSAPSVDTLEYAYQYDDIGNRITSTDLGTNRTYVANSLNQYSAIMTSDSGLQTSSFTPQYDDDGNQTLIQTSTGVWSVQYNGENRPVLWTGGTPSAATNIVMSFDRMGRRVEYRETQTTSASGGSTTTINTHHRFVYDDYLCIQRLEAADGNTIDLAFVWDVTEPVATRPLIVDKPEECKVYTTHDGNKNVSDLIFLTGGSGVATHYDYEPFGASTTSTHNSTFTVDDFRTCNPFRFSSEYTDDTLGLVYFNFRHYNQYAGKWFCRDPYIGTQDKNGFTMCFNGTIYSVDLLGLWSSVGIETHQNMVREAITRMSSSVKCMRSYASRGVVTSAIIDGNVGMDIDDTFSATTTNALPLHYNRMLGQSPRDAIRKFIKGVAERREALNGMEGTTTSEHTYKECKSMLDKLGQLTHMLQDYYGHGVGWDYVKGSDDMLIGRAYGSPDDITARVDSMSDDELMKAVLKPSSYGGKVKASEHGPLWWREPGYRAPDTQLRYERSVEMTTRELEKYLPIWCDKCCEELKLMEREARIESLQEALRHEVFFVL